MTALAIRLLAPADAADFQRLRLAGLLESPAAFLASHDDEKDSPLADVARRLEPGPDGAVLGAFDGDALVGIVGVGRDPRAKVRNKGYVWGMVVHPSARGRGVARALVRAVMAHARMMPGIERLDLVSDAENVAAISLYESLGFVAYGREPDAMRLLGQSRDDVLMARRLEDLRP